MRAALLPLLVALPSLLAGCAVEPAPPGYASAKALLDPRVAPTLVVEVDYAPGHEPDRQALDTLLSTLVNVTTRPASAIQLRLEPDISPHPGRPFRQEEIDALEAAHRDARPQEGQAALYILYLPGTDGEASANDVVMGVTYGESSIAIFKETIRGASRGSLLEYAPEQHCVERAVLVHEMGHAAGLVNRGAPMSRAREDPANPAHSTNPESVMFHAVESRVDLLSFFTGGCADIPYEFDADDLADLRRLRTA